MCKHCGKNNCCCTKTVSKTGPRGPVGPRGPEGPVGPMGPGIIQFIPIAPNDANESTITQYDSSPVLEAGNYIVSLEANIAKVGGSDISFNSYVRKNGASDTLNTNYQHLNRTLGLNCTHTHTAKVILAIGETAGIELSMSASAKVLNGSVLLSKISS